MKRVILLTALLAATGCGGSSPSAPDVPPTSSGSYAQTDLVLGTGATAVAGKTAALNYTGWLYDTGKPFGKGTQFQTGSFSFIVSSGQVIKGFDQGVLGMQVGGQRRLIIPPELAYGSSPPPNSGIPVNATLVFEITLTAIQ
jgi:FKBP-type peptidyl-prolyl cis-trans isomerase FkpA